MGPNRQETTDLVTDNKVILNENFYFSFSGISLLHLLKSNICKDFKVFQRRIC